MSYPLCIIAPQIGARSETFIRRHMEQLLPGKTVVIAGTVDGPYAGHWQVQCPTLVLNRLPPVRLRIQFGRACLQKLGWKPADQDIVHVRRFLKAHGVEVVMGEYLDVSLAWMSLAHELGIRLFGHGHGYDIAEYLRVPKWRSEYLRFNSCGGIITVSELSRRRLVELGVKPEKINVIPCGVDVPAAPVQRVEHSPVRCLAVGRMAAVKAPILTLEAFRRACGVCPGLHLDYVGGGPLLSAADQFLEAFDLGDKVTLHDAQPSDVVQGLMRQADVFVQHSRVNPRTGAEEGLPVAILEAMANGLPVVSTRHAGIPEAVQEGRTGFLVDEGDSETMGVCIARLAADFELRRQMGEAGWARVRDSFSAGRERLSLLETLGLAQESG